LWVNFASYYETKFYAFSYRYCIMVCSWEWLPVSFAYYYEIKFYAFLIGISYTIMLLGFIAS